MDDITVENLKKRLIMRAEHRGIKEMDIIMGGYVRHNIDRFSKEKIFTVERFMEIDDQALYQMILGNEAAPEEFKPLVDEIREHIEMSHK